MSLKSKDLRSSSGPAWGKIPQFPPATLGLIRFFPQENDPDWTRALKKSRKMLRQCYWYLLCCTIIYIYIYRVYTCNVRNFQDTVRTCIYVFSFFMYTSLLKKHYINHHIYWRKTEWNQRLFNSISEPSGCGALVFSNKCSGSTFCRAELSFHDQWGVLYGYDWKWLEPE